mmetsp:Transcript_11702/g.28409  ORF Transcript_11702/g.28409 Transcript_11702/m.28409 type:complete len:273 (-) Transcript_11702:85-903(-)
MTTHLASTRLADVAIDSFEVDDGAVHGQDNVSSLDEGLHRRVRALKIHHLLEGLRLRHGPNAAHKALLLLRAGTDKQRLIGDAAHFAVLGAVILHFPVDVLLDAVGEDAEFVLRAEHRREVRVVHVVHVLLERRNHDAVLDQVWSPDEGRRVEVEDFRDQRGVLFGDEMDHVHAQAPLRRLRRADEAELALQGDVRVLVRVRLRGHRLVLLVPVVPFRDTVRNVHRDVLDRLLDLDRLLHGLLHDLLDDLLLRGPAADWHFWRLCVLSSEAM